MKVFAQEQMNLDRGDRKGFAKEVTFQWQLKEKRQVWVHLGTKSFPSKVNRNCKSHRSRMSLACSGKRTKAKGPGALVSTQRRHSYRGRRWPRALVGLVCNWSWRVSDKGMAWYKVYRAHSGWVERRSECKQGDQLGGYHSSLCLRKRYIGGGNSTLGNVSWKHRWSWIWGLRS